MTVEKYILIQLCFAALFLIVGAIVLTVLIVKQKYIKNGLPRKKPDPIDRFKIVECSNKDDYKHQEIRPGPPPPPPPMKTFYNFQTEDHLQVPLKNVNRPCIDIEGYCQNRMPNGRCTSFVCTKIVRFK